MSAFDISGAVVWTFLAFCGWYDLAAKPPAYEKLDDPGKGFVVVITAFLTLASVFCISRLCGAHL